jgi:hypothetical protein
MSDSESEYEFGFEPNNAMEDMEDDIFDRFSQVIQAGDVGGLELLITDGNTREWWDFNADNVDDIEEGDLSVFIDDIIRMMVTHNGTHTTIMMILTMINSYIGESVGNDYLLEILATNAVENNKFEIVREVANIVDGMILISRDGMILRTINWSLAFDYAVEQKTDNLHMIMFLLPKLRLYYKSVRDMPEFLDIIQFALKILYRYGNYVSFRYLFEATPEIRHNLDMHRIYDTEMFDQNIPPTNEIIANRQRITTYLADRDEVLNNVVPNVALQRNPFYPSELPRMNLNLQRIRPILHDNSDDNSYQERKSPDMDYPPELPRMNPNLQRFRPILHDNGEDNPYQERKSPDNQEEEQKHQSRNNQRHSHTPREEKSDSEPSESNGMFRWDD